jgi:hypothetical protein
MSASTSRRYPAWPIALAAAAPVLALAGCPGLLNFVPTPGASPTASPAASPAASPTPAPSASQTAAPTPTATPAPGRLILTDFEFNSTGQHYFKIRNIGGKPVDITEYAITYQSPTATESLNRRLNEQRTTLKEIAPLTSIKIIPNATGSSSGTTWFLAVDSELGGPGGTGTIGMQTSGGSLALFKGADDDDDYKAINVVDYLQWGAAKSPAYTRESVAAAAGVWAAGTYAPAGSPGKELNPKTKGATGSANWELTDQDDD